jgi:hypothetical protein
LIQIWIHMMWFEGVSPSYMRPQAEGGHALNWVKPQAEWGHRSSIWRPIVEVGNRSKNEMFILGFWISCHRGQGRSAHQYEEWEVTTIIRGCKPKTHLFLYKKATPKSHEIHNLKIIIWIEQRKRNEPKPRLDWKCSDTNDVGKFHSIRVQQ